MTSKASFHFSPTTEKNLNLWLHGEMCDETTKITIQNLLSSAPEKIEDGFYKNLEFGTGGLRGLMGVGPNRVNMQTIEQTSKGISEYVIECFPEKKWSVVIGFDSRIDSKNFAKRAAQVFGASGFHVYLFEEISPTPLVSFACRYFEASIAVMITASHNPKEYNGYKVYWSYGGQVLPPHDIGMIECVERVQNRIDTTIALVDISDPTIQYIDSKIDIAYYSAIQKQLLFPSHSSKNLQILYSSLHGTGGRLIEQSLKNAGFSDIQYVEEQMIPDGLFPTVAQPNPESKDALRMGIDLLQQKKLDIFLASDPDADRLGVVVMHKGSPVILNGNQIVSIMCEYICRYAVPQHGIDHSQYGIVKSCVTTPLIEAIAERWNMTVINVLPGFKYIAQQIEKWSVNTKDPITFIFGGEESYGSLTGLHARDKDAISAAVLISEIAWDLKKSDKSLVDLLDELYDTYGYFYEDLINISYPDSKEGYEKMKDALFKLRHTSPTHINNLSIIAEQDLDTGNYRGEELFRMKGDFPKSSALIYTLEDRTRIIIRPSGTEPKVKIYLFYRSLKKMESSGIEEHMRLLKNWLQCNLFLN